MTDYKPNADVITKQIEEIANGSEGRFISNFYGNTLDGSDVAAYLQSIGFDVVEYKDAGHCGLTTLANGVKVSTNGYAYK